MSIVCAIHRHSYAAGTGRAHVECRFKLSAKLLNAKERDAKYFFHLTTIFYTELHGSVLSVHSAQEVQNSIFKIFKEYSRRIVNIDASGWLGLKHRSISNGSEKPFSILTVLVSWLGVSFQADACIVSVMSE